MPHQPRVVVANHSCWDVYARNESWLAQQPAEIVSEAHFHQMPAQEFEQVLQGAHGAVGPWREITLQQMQKCDTLQVISLACSGYESVNLNDATRTGIVVTNAPVVELSEAVADHTIGLMLATARKIPQHHFQICHGNHSRGLHTTIWQRTLGIVGLGAIGRAVARRAVGFGMPLLATEPYPDESFLAEYSIELVDLDTLLERSDFVSLHVRLTPATEFMIGRRELQLMKSSAILVNTARQDLIDERALSAALTEREIAGAGLDDPPHDSNSPLLQREDVVLTPHLGNRTYVACDAMLRRGVTNALAVFRGQRPDNVLNPEVYDAELRAVRPVE